MEMRKAMLLILPFLLVAFPTSAADPNQEGNWTRCLNTDPDLAVAGCTAVIAAGQGPTGKLAEAFFKRGVAYGRKGQDDRAIEDFDQAIKLNPNLAVAFLGRCALRPHLGQL